MIVFDEICETTQGVQISKANQASEKLEGYERYLYISDLLHDKGLKYIKNDFPHKIVTENDLVVANTGSPGRVFRGKYGILSNNLFRLSFDSNIADKEYLYFILSSPTFQGSLQKQMKGGIQKHLGHKTMGKQKIPLPSLDQQKKIAAILDAADAYRQKTKALIEKYDELTQSLFLDMFGDPVTNPKGWEMIPFSNVTTNKNSLRVPIKKEDRENLQGAYPYYGATGIVDYINDYKFDGEFLLIAEDGKNLDNRNKPIAWIARGQFWVNNHSHVVAFNGVANLTFLSYQLNGIDISKYVTGIDQFKMNKSNLNRIPISIPPIELQNQFADRVQAIEAQKTQAQASLVQAENLFNSLLQKAFKGELV